MRTADLRPATQDDLAQLNDIYNRYVRETYITFDLEPITIDARRDWLKHYSEVGPHRVFVAAEGAVVLGYATSSPWRSPLLRRHSHPQSRFDRAPRAPRVHPG